MPNAELLPANASAIEIKNIKNLKNPDTIEVNGEKFQVIENTSLFYDTKKKHLEMMVGLVKIGSKHLQPSHRLVYINETPKDVRFFFFDKGEWAETKIKSIKLQPFEEVRRLLGRPDQDLRTGARAEWVYPELRVIFTEDKVTVVRY